MKLWAVHPSDSNAKWSIWWGNIESVLKIVKQIVIVGHYLCMKYWGRRPSPCAQVTGNQFPFRREPLCTPAEGWANSFEHQSNILFDGINNWAGVTSYLYYAAWKTQSNHKSIGSILKTSSKKVQRVWFGNSHWTVFFGLTRKFTSGFYISTRKSIFRYAIYYEQINNNSNLPGDIRTEREMNLCT